MSQHYRIMIVAGEPSGDAHAASLVRALRQVAPDAKFEFFGATGRLMRAESVETVVDSEELAIMGIVEVGVVLPRFIKAFRGLKRAAFENKPDAVILVDWPEFNLRLATSLHRRGLKVIYYISPQLWAWRPKRVGNIQRDVDLLLSILPFEAEWYKERGVTHVEFVGHPLAGEVKPRLNREEFCQRHQLDPNRPIISFLPGSRLKELQRILPPMLAAVKEINYKRPDVQCVLCVAPSRTIEETRNIIARQNGDLGFETLKVIHGETREALAASDASAVASGTATLEAALVGTPMVIVYKESPINWHTLGRLITAEHFGLVNLVAGERVVTELMQDDLTGAQLSQELLGLLDKNRNAELRQRLKQVADRLGDPGASERAAQKVIAALTEWKDWERGRPRPQ
ncbi:MAG TPA: lipid-A-disaccharide synthase [Pyrinomonadaceae bacterium]|nr:lipid-A-disaccharide synthase [Pyrinomonadaceae bacterium]